MKKRYEVIKEKLKCIKFDKNLSVTHLSEDARYLNSIKSHSVDLIITSPPYANTYDYYLYHKQRMNWLGFDFKGSQNLEIGSRHEYSSKKRPVENWTKNITEFIFAMKRVVKLEGYICIVIGDSVVSGIFYDVLEAIRNISQQLNLEFVYSTSTSLSKNTRKFNHKFRSKMDKKEHVIILKTRDEI